MSSNYFYFFFFFLNLFLSIKGDWQLNDNIQIIEIVNSTFQQKIKVVRRPILNQIELWTWSQSYGFILQSRMMEEDPIYLLDLYSQGISLFLNFSSAISVLNIGLGAGSLVKFVLFQNRLNNVVSIEIDEQIILLAQKYFKINEDWMQGRHRVIQGDGLDILEGFGSNEKFNVIIVDVGGPFEVVPSHLKEERSIWLLKLHLKVGGVIVQNIFEEKEEKYQKLLRKYWQYFIHVFELKINGIHNRIIGATDSDLSCTKLKKNVENMKIFQRIDSEVEDFECIEWHKKTLPIILDIV